jgi:hypothetical protein
VSLLNFRSMSSNTTAPGQQYLDFRLYRYEPSLPAAAVSVAVFGILTALHVWRVVRSKALYFIAFIVGGVCEFCVEFAWVSPADHPVQTFGYCGRIWSHFDQMSIGGFVIQAILILVAPALYAASIYMILGRLIRKLRADHLSLLPARWVTRIFVAGDVVSFTLQVGGGGIQAAGSLSLLEAGEKIIIAGLFVQIFIFGFFVATSALFHTRVIKEPTLAAVQGSVPWRRHLYVLYVASAIILVRSIFRVIEYLQGNRGYLISHEVFLYVFDTVLMVAVMVLFLVWYVDDLDRAFKDEYVEMTIN